MCCIVKEELLYKILFLEIMDFQLDTVAVRPSLGGMLFNFTISGQTNRTTCIKTPKYKNRGFKCHERYAYTSLPNFIGYLDKHNVWINSNLVPIILEFFSLPTSHFVTSTSKNLRVAWLIQNVIQLIPGWCTFAERLVMILWNPVSKYSHPFCKT